MGGDWTWLAELGGFGSLSVVLWLVLNRVMSRQEEQDMRHSSERKEWADRMDRHVDLHRQGLDRVVDKLEQAIRESHK